MNQVLAAALVTFIGGVLTGCGTSSTEIADFSVVTDLPKEVGPGGFDKTISKDGFATGFFFQVEISDCSQQVDQVARTWASENGLTEQRRTLERGRATLHFTSAQPQDGVFVISYVLVSDRKSARVTVTHKGGSGEHPSAQSFESLGIGGLIDNLLTAARCQPTGQDISQAF